MRKLKNLLGESAIYGLANIITRFITIFLVPIYTKIFSPSDYGDMSLINLSFSLTSLLVILGLDSASAYFFYDLEGEKRKIPIANWFWVQILFSLVIGIVVYLFSEAFSTILLGSSNYSFTLIIAFSNLFFFSFRVILIKWFRYQRKPIPTVAITLAASLLTIVLNYYFVVNIKAGIDGVFFANLIISVLFAIITTIYMWHWISPRLLNWSMLKQMLSFGLPLLPASLSSWINNSSASFFINYLTGSKDEVGLFQIGYNLAAGMLLFTGAFQMAFLPFAYSIKSELDSHKTYNLVFIGYTFLGTFLALFLSLFSKEILVLLTNENYYPSSNVASILAFSFLFIGFNSFGLLSLSLARKNKFYSMSILIASCLNVVGLLIFVPYLAKEGAASVLMVSNFISVILLFYFSKKFYFIPFDFIRSLLVVSFGFFLAIIHVSGLFESLVLFRLGYLLIFGLFAFAILKSYLKS